MDRGQCCLAFTFVSWLSSQSVCDSARAPEQRALGVALPQAAAACGGEGVSRQPQRDFAQHDGPPVSAAASSHLLNYEAGWNAGL